MPYCKCNRDDCIFNLGGICDVDEIGLDDNGTCQTYEQKS